MLKKIVPYILLFSLLGNQVEFHQFLKLPELVTHYLEHKCEESTLSFSEFLLQHYQHKKDHDSSHEDLPFKSDACHHGTQVMVCELVPEFGVTSTFTHVSASFYSAGNCCSDRYNKVWQPPQFI